MTLLLFVFHSFQSKRIAIQSQISCSICLASFISNHNDLQRKRSFPKKLPPTKQKICHILCHIIRHWTRIPKSIPEHRHRTITSSNQIGETLFKLTITIEWLKTSFTMTNFTSIQPKCEKWHPNQQYWYQNSVDINEWKKPTQYSISQINRSHGP